MILDIPFCGDICPHNVRFTDQLLYTHTYTKFESKLEEVISIFYLHFFLWEYKQRKSTHATFIQHNGIFLLFVYILGVNLEYI